MKIQEANAFKNLRVLIITDQKHLRHVDYRKSGRVITELNLAAEGLTGFSREEALCRLFEEIVHLGENTRASGT
jgi:hypothetical protein